MSDAQGWPEKPGAPLNPERDGVHWLQITSPDDSLLVAALWEEGLWSCPSLADDFTPETMARLGEAVRYLGPCHTPAEVAALVEAARHEEREACAVVAEECDLPWNSPTDEQHDNACAMADRIAAAIRARGGA